MMKKILFLSFCTLVLFSCEKDDLGLDTRVEKKRSEIPLTRSAGDIPDAIEQLNGIPVNIRSVSNKTYLSAQSSSGNSVNLAANDDGSLRQRWNIELRHDNIFYAYVTLMGGNNSFGKAQIGVVHQGSRWFPQLSEQNLITNINVFNSGDGLTYNIVTVGEPLTFPFPTLFYLQPENGNSTRLIAADPNNKGDLIKWEIIPVDEFRIEDIAYDLTTNDQLSVIPTQIAVKTLVNDTDVAATRTISFQETITNESSFSELIGVKITDKISASFKVGIAKFLNGEFTGETATENTWTYTTGGKETQSYVISETVTQEVPPRTTIEAKLIATKYNATLTYIAKLYGINSQKIIYLKGKWNGAVVQESKIILTQKGKMLRTIVVRP